MYQARYGPVILDVTTVNSWEERLLTSPDGVDAECTEISVSFTSVWSPWTQGTFPGGPPANVPGAVLKTFLRRVLAEPRQLFMFGIPDHSGSSPTVNVLVRSPLNRSGTTTLYPMDARNGPQVVVQSISEMTGESTFVVDLKITTWINEATAVRRVVSNRWTSIREINDCFWARLIISGITRFRSDAMRMPDGTVLSPDQFLQSATPPVPNGFQRREIRAEVSSDGLQLTWAVVDSQCALMPVNRKIARIRGYYQDSYDPISAANALSMGTAGAEIGTMVGGLIGGVVGAIVGGVTGMFPKQTLTVSIRVDGHPDATPTDLAEALALCVGGLRLGGKSLFKSISSAFIHTNSLTQSLDDDSRWAQIFIQFNGSSATSGALALFGLAPGATRRYLFTDDNGNPLPPDQTGLGDPSKPNGMVALVPDNTNPANRAAKSGTPPSPQDWSRNDWYTAFMRAADVKTTEQPATSITSVAEQRTGVGVGDSKLLKDI